MNLRLTLLSCLLALATTASAQNTTTATTPAVATPAVAQQISATQASLATSAAALQASLGSSNFTLSTQLQSAVSSLTGNATAAPGNSTVSGLASVKSLTQLYQSAQQAKLTPEQLKLAGQVRDEASALVLQRNLSAQNPALAGPVNDIVTSLQSRNYTAAAKDLTTIYTSAPLTAEQKTLVKGLAKQYTPNAAAAAEAALHSFGF
jgi:precorrin-4 methylase